MLLSLPPQLLLLLQFTAIAILFDVIYCYNHFDRLFGLLTMATLSVLVDCYTRLQQSRLQPNILAMTTSVGKFSIPFGIFIAFSGITDEPLLESYIV
jgi:1,4-dihydroxy-2-naphthoate octaprenyltransferase